MKRRLRPFLSLLWDGHRAESLAVLVTLLAMLLTEGIGLLLLLPALAAAGVPLGDDGHAGALVTGLQAALRSVGLSATLGWMLVIVALLVSARAAIQLAQSLLSARLEASVVQRLRARLFAAVVEMPWPRFTRERPGALLHALGPQVDDVHTALLLLLHITAQVATVLAVGAVSLLVAPGATALVAAAGIVLVVATRALRAPGIHLADELLLASNNVFARIAELLGAQKMIKAHGAEADATAAITREVANWARRSRHIGGQRATLAFASSVLSVAMLAAIVWLVVRYTSVAPASLLLLLVLYVRLVPRLADMQQSIAVFDQSSSALASVTALLQRCESATGDAGWRTGAVHAATSPAASTRPPALSVRAVTVRYPEAEQPAIEDFSCEIPAGTITVVFGASGAGKTTLGDLLLGLLEPERGTVLVDGQPLAGTVRQRWRDRVGYLAQEPMLLHGTIRENLLLARPRASEVELHEALRAAACDFVDALPQGLDAPVGERGVLVSGGERQRLALARALLRQPGLLVLDEATSALDAETEQRILQTVRQLAGRCTVIFATHREAPRAIADQVIEL